MFFHVFPLSQGTVYLDTCALKWLQVFPQAQSFPVQLQSFDLAQGAQTSFAKLGQEEEKTSSNCE